MKKVSQLFAENDRKRIADAIEKAEQKTSAEIVTVVATASGRYDRAEDIVGFLTALLAVTAGWLACPAFHSESAWETGPSISGLFPVLVSMVAGFVAGSALASRLPSLRLPFIPKKELEEEVQRAAQAAFMSSRIRKTAGGTGILLFVSFYEHRVVVLPDDAIVEKLPGQDWGKLCDAIVSGMKANRPTEALEEAVTRCGDILGGVLPRQDDDDDELSNELILID
ncbi:MAG: putative membrane protein [Candidatus Binatia bacterium]|jgi:putative membrane protein